MSRVNTKAELVFDSVSIERLMEASQSGAESVGLTGRTETDGSGSFFRMTGVGAAEIGMAFFPEDGGTDCTDGILSRFVSEFGEGVLMVVDRFEMEFAFYIVDGPGCRSAKAVLAE